MKKWHLFSFCQACVVSEQLGQQQSITSRVAALNDRCRLHPQRIRIVRQQVLQLFWFQVFNFHHPQWDSRFSSFGTSSFIFHAGRAKRLFYLILKNECVVAIEAWLESEISCARARSEKVTNPCGWAQLRSQHTHAVFGGRPKTEASGLAVNAPRSSRLVHEHWLQDDGESHRNSHFTTINMISTKSIDHSLYPRCSLSKCLNVSFFCVILRAALAQQKREAKLKLIPVGDTRERMTHDAFRRSWTRRSEISQIGLMVCCFTFEAICWTGIHSADSAGLSGRQSVWESCQATPAIWGRRNTREPPLFDSRCRTLRSEVQDFCAEWYLTLTCAAPWLSNKWSELLRLGTGRGWAWRPQKNAKKKSAEAFTREIYGWHFTPKWDHFVVITNIL